MAKSSKLLLALDAHKGRDYEKERQKKLAKAAEKRKGKKAVEAKDVDVEEEQVDDNQDKNEAVEEIEEDQNDVEEEEEGDEEEEEEDIPLSDLSGDERADVIPHQRLTINNSAAINTSIKRISFITGQTAFSEHNSLVSNEPLDVPDPNDDLTRELAFYKVCQAAAIDARRLLKKEGVPFTRPTDYFAEMIKTDEHMTKIKKKLYDEAAAKKASADARRQRDLKKFGKQVQVAKLQQRQKEKKETLEKINSLKRKRKTDQSATTNDEDLFDIAVDNATSKPDKGSGGASSKRQKKNEKYGFGGKKRFAKSGDAMSSSDLRGFSVKKMKTGGKKSGGAAKRPGKNRRKAMQ
ncbi:eukaryotic rRNA processing protein EBP2-domain-containing protein [Talaromyces proteolyticus]|uniref:Eukaryotic rRNA processing protein EBP2-domain-containing protein n=1 Tax=Talaromyces proteolyticus TaxID=1131652 RepID=A0AAD4PZT3_9EURO|nr:eukaryotic rRNA processing protein EBP2-domain-containing protein [Talaromyces proteolyticus]KAH8696203.1 eukaryotic rRNA processing protein EBP2-domain-containing protein [Talaromyces proteolyticus]